MPDSAELTTSQRIARGLLFACLAGLGVWMLRRFLPALCWAVVLAIATSAWYDRWLALHRGRRRELWAAATFTALVGVVLIAPLVYGVAIAVHEAISLVRAYLASAQGGPPALPAWLSSLPWIGHWVQNAWRDVFANTGATPAMLAHARPTLFEWTRRVGVQAVHRVVTLGFTLLALFFVELHREALAGDVSRVGRRLFGRSVDALLVQAAAAIRATVDGVVLVALVEGLIMGVTYAVVRVPHPILIGAVTGLFALIPFAAPIAFGCVALVLVAQGSIAAGVAVAAVGGVMLFVADHVVRPAIIGGEAQLPFLWVLLGLLGGVESFGLLGIFLGPALLAALLAIWRGGVTGTGVRAA